MNDCAKIQEMISAMLDGELSENERAAVEGHIKSCPECAAMYADFAALSEGMGEMFAEVPDSLHDKIMKGVRTAAKPKKSVLITLRPYMSAAACLVVIIGAIFALRDSRNDIKWLSSTSDTAALSEPASAPAAAAEDCAECESYIFQSGVSAEESIETADSNKKSESRDTILDEPAAAAPDTPAEMPAAEPEEVPAEDASDCDYPVLEPWEIELRGRPYTPGTEIDWALLTSYEGVETVDIRYLADVAAIRALLMDTPAEVEPDAVPRDPAALLELQCGSEYCILKLYSAGESLIVETSEGFYIAAGTLEELLSIK